MNAYSTLAREPSSRTDHLPDDRKSIPLQPMGSGCPVQSFADARALLRDDDLHQASFRADLMARFSDERFAPIIFQHGERHRRQRAATARFFTPKTVDTSYRAIIEREADALIGDMQRRGHAKLDEMSLRLAVTVAAEIVGVTDSNRAGMSRRLERFFRAGNGALGKSILDLPRFARAQIHMLNFYVRDVFPAVVTRRHAPREDVISHLIAEGYSDRAILTECVTYAAAGMVTTREFITMAGWHLLEREDLRTRFLAADEYQQIAILEEILRLEPVVGVLSRRNPNTGEIFTIDIRKANVDVEAVGACPHAIDPDRTLAARVGGTGLAFGDGSHRCPGASVAILETAIFLDRLLRVANLTLETPPKIKWNTLITGYELRDCRLSIAKQGSCDKSLSQMRASEEEEAHN